MTDIVAVDNAVIFQFEQRVTQEGMFVEDSGSDIILGSNEHESGNTDRWVNVIQAGPKVTVFGPGDRVLVKHQMWTTAFTVNGERYWKTDLTNVLAVDDS